MSNDLHQSPPKTAGDPLDAAVAAVILVHGRGASAAGMLELSKEFPTNGIAYIAPQADHNTWYPRSFLEPIEDNEPWLSAALNRLKDMRDTVTAAGIPGEQLLFLGFSQGACLASEFVARHPRRYGGLAALSGGLIGPLGMHRQYHGTLDDTPVFLGCSDIDPHIPLDRVDETASVFESMDATVTKRIYEGMGHGINRDELETVATMIDALGTDE